MNEKTFEQVLEENGAFCWKNVGVSMRPLIKEGRDIMIIKKRPEGRLNKYDAVLFRRPGVTGRGAYVLHRILKVNANGTYWIVGDNCIGGETVKEENVLGVLTGLSRKGRQIDFNSPWYRLYVKMWCAPYRMRFFILKYKSLPRRAAGKLKRMIMQKLK